MRAAADGDLVVVGSFFDDDPDNSGAAYIYRFDGSSWIEEAKLRPDDPTWSDQFGRSVDVSGNLAVVAADLDDVPGVNSGAAYVFAHDGTGWVRTARLTAPDGMADDRFGVSASIDGDTVLVGAYFDSGPEYQAGSAYVFRDVAAGCAPPCPGDTDGSGGVDVDDFLAVLAAWGRAPAAPKTRTATTWSASTTSWPSWPPGDRARKTPVRRARRQHPNQPMAPDVTLRRLFF